MLCYSNGTDTRKLCDARKPRDAAAVLFGLKFGDDTHYKFKSIHAWKASSELQTCWHKTEFNAKWRFKVIQSQVF